MIIFPRRNGNYNIHPKFLPTETSKKQAIAQSTSLTNYRNSQLSLTPARKLENATKLTLLKPFKKFHTTDTENNIVGITLITKISQPKTF